MGGPGSGRPRKSRVNLLDPKLRLYERQPKETDPAWYAFKAYRDAGLPRTLSKTAKTLGISVQSVSRWSTMWRWKDRITAWDRDHDNARTQGALEGVAAMAKRHMANSSAIQGLAMTELKKLERISKKGAEPITGLKTVLSIIVEGAKLDRLVRDQPTEKTDTGPGLDLAKLSDAELIAFRKLQKKAATD